MVWHDDHLTRASGRGRSSSNMGGRQAITVHCRSDKSPSRIDVRIYFSYIAYYYSTARLHGVLCNRSETRWSMIDGSRKGVQFLLPPSRPQTFQTTLVILF